MISSSAEVILQDFQNVQTTPLKRIVHPSVNEMQCLIAEPNCRIHARSR